MISYVIGLFKLFNITKYVTNIIPLLIKHWKVAVFVIMSGIIWYQNFWDGPEFLFGLDTIPNKHEEVLSLHKQVSDLGKYNTELESSINKTNMFIDEWKKTTEQYEKDKIILQKKIQQIQKQAMVSVNNTLAEEVPKSCDEAFEYLKKGVIDLKW